MIGGDQADFEKAKDKINCYSKKMKLLGKAGNGQLAKMVNQICIAGLVQGLSEGINFVDFGWSEFATPGYEFATKKYENSKNEKYES